MGYRIFTLSLAAVAEEQQVMAPNIAISSVHALALSAGGSPTIRIGANPHFPAFAGYSADLCPPELNGLHWSNPVAVPGGVLTLQVWHGGGSSGGPA